VFTPRIVRGFPLWLSLTATLAVSGAGCASSSPKQCPSEVWSGTCKLRGITKVEEREMPVPWIVYEAIYTPQANPQYPQFTPADVRVRLGAQAQYEQALKKHLNAQADVTCHAEFTAGSCIPGDVKADVVEFDAAHAQALEATHAKGCAAIESVSDQERLSQSRQTSAVISERFSFADGSAALAPEATDTGNAIAKRLAADPSIECLGLVGQITNGEPPALAEQRARAVRGLLVSLGVDKSRLTTIAVTESVYGAAAKPQAAEANNRRVSLSVLLKTAPAGQ
jgi:outer membrane protein OmpA-like peptidoglycan-associated protein